MPQRTMSPRRSVAPVWPAGDQARQRVTIKGQPAGTGGRPGQQPCSTPLCQRASPPMRAIQPPPASAVFHEAPEAAEKPVCPAPASANAASVASNTWCRARSRSRTETHKPLPATRRKQAPAGSQPVSVTIVPRDCQCVYHQKMQKAPAKLKSAMSPALYSGETDDRRNQPVTQAAADQ